MRRADRLFQIVQFLRGRRLTTAAFLAGRLGVSLRTVYRDVRDLSLSGVPVEGEAGVGYRLRAGFDVPPLMFTLNEIEALAVGARMVEAWGGPVLADSARTAIEKIVAALPADRRVAVEKTRLYAPAFHVDGRSMQQLESVREAIGSRRVLHLDYRRAGATSGRSRSTTGAAPGRSAPGASGARTSAISALTGSRGSKRSSAATRTRPASGWPISSARWKRGDRGGPAIGLLAAEQVLLDARRGEDVVARVLKLPPQPRQIDVEQLAFPFAHLARDDDRLDVGAIHQRYHRARHLVERRDVDRLGVEDDDVGLLARRERAGLAVEPQALGAVHGAVAQHVAGREQGRRAGGRRRPLLGRQEIALLEDHLVHDHALHVHADAHLGEEVRRHRALHVHGERRLHAKALHLDDRRLAVAHVHLDRERDRDLGARVLDRLPAHV